jgi:hypothetical protein
VAMGAVAAMLVFAPGAGARTHVLRVGTYRGMRGQYRSIQGAIDAAHKGDWILIGPGDYHPRADYTKRHHAPSDESGSGVLIQTNRLHIRGMNRNRVIVDGTKPSAHKPCTSNPKKQAYGPKGKGGKPVGRNGIVVAKASGVSIDNLTACNFLGEGNQIWWNGGDGSGKIGMGPWYGKYLSATTTYYDPAREHQASYGEFVSNASGPGRLAHSYASNMDDAGVYIGACQRKCHATVTTSHFEFNALGYSGTNAGGELVLKKSEWDRNASGIVTNSQNNDDAPSPQDGTCPKGKGPTGTYSCTIFERNNVHDNNNSHTPLTTPSPIGSGIIIAGGRADSVVGNTVTHNNAWGILLVPYPDTDTPPPIAHCQGGTQTPAGCIYWDWANQIFGNTLSNNGSYGNPTNGDLAEASIPEPNNVSNCWYDNKHPDGSAATTDPPDLDTIHGKSACGQPQTEGGDSGPLLAQVGCDARVLPCTPDMNYPSPDPSKVRIHKLPHQKSMPNPCRGVPRNPWCRRRRGG